MNALRHYHDIDPDEFLNFVHDIPLGRFIQPDPELGRLLEKLPLRKIIFTNADAQHARKVLSRLDILRHFEFIIDIHMLEFINKPDGRSYLKALEFASARPEECVLIEDSLINIHPARKIGMTTVLVFGGSGGAHTVNRSVSESLPLLAGIKGKAQFIHQTGEKDLKMVEAAYASSGFNAVAMPFIYEMAEAYACADLVVCRSGALTLAEITALGKPAVLVPYPFAANNHQELNARELETAGAALVVRDNEATAERMAEEIAGLVNDAALLADMSSKARALGRPSAARDVLTGLKALAKDL